MKVLINYYIPIQNTADVLRYITYTCISDQDYSAKQKNIFFRVIISTDSHVNHMVCVILLIMFRSYE